MSIDPDDLRLVAYALGEVDDPQERAAIEAELALCEPARQAVEQTRRTVELIRLALGKHPPSHAPQPPVGPDCGRTEGGVAHRFSGGGNGNPYRFSQGCGAPEPQASACAASEATRTTWAVSEPTGMSRALPRVLMAGVVGLAHASAAIAEWIGVGPPKWTASEMTWDDDASWRPPVSQDAESGALVRSSRCIAPAIRAPPARMARDPPVYNPLGGSSVPGGPGPPWS